jgi:hypothetical protein
MKKIPRCRLLLNNHAMRKTRASKRIGRPSDCISCANHLIRINMVRARASYKAEPCPTQRVEPSRPHRQMPDRGGTITGRDAYAQQVHTHVFIP